MTVFRSQTTKSIVRSLARLVLGVDFVWDRLKPFASPTSYLRVQRDVVENRRFLAKRTAFFSSSVVPSGPFAGLEYPPDLHHWGTSYPKLLGTYEAELHGVLRDFTGIEYDNVVNIGFAEGFYLAGLGRLFPSAQLWGFDIDLAAHRICMRLAQTNGIDPQRVHLAESATARALEPILARRSLLVCDCEGYEKILFTSAPSGLWTHADLIVECHDLFVPGSTAAVTAALQATHDLTLVSTVPLEEKIDQVSATVRSYFNRREILRLLDEGRPAPMQWLIAQAKAWSTSMLASASR